MSSYCKPLIMYHLGIILVNQPFEELINLIYSFCPLRGVVLAIAGDIGIPPIILEFTPKTQRATKSPFINCVVIYVVKDEAPTILLIGPTHLYQHIIHLIKIFIQFLHIFSPVSILYLDSLIASQNCNPSAVSISAIVMSLFSVCPINSPFGNLLGSQLLHNGV